MSKLQEGIVLGLMTASFIFGYMTHRSSSQPAQTDVKDQVTQVKDNHTTITTITHKDKNGDLKVIKTIDSDTKTNRTDDKQTDTQPAAKTWNVSALAGYDLSKPKDLLPIYGVSVSKQVLGPFTLGAYGMTNGILGVMIGVTF